MITKAQARASYDVMHMLNNADTNVLLEFAADVFDELKARMTGTDGCRFIEADQETVDAISDTFKKIIADGLISVAALAIDELKTRVSEV
jgi:hypothetical protein